MGAEPGKEDNTKKPSSWCPGLGQTYSWLLWPHVAGEPHSLGAAAPPHPGASGFQLPAALSTREGEDLPGGAASHGWA